MAAQLHRTKVWRAAVVSQAQNNHLVPLKSKCCSTGDILLFLHADTKLPRGFDTMIRQCLLKPRVLAGAFRFGVDPESYTRPTPPRGIGFISWVANLRAKYLQLPYGDQVRGPGVPGCPVSRDVCEPCGFVPLVVKGVVPLP